MKSIEPTKFNIEFLESARECASYIFDSECEQISYQSYIEEGNDPKDHILYHAGLILGKEDEFKTDIEEYNKLYNE